MKADLGFRVQVRVGAIATLAVALFVLGTGFSGHLHVDPLSLVGGALAVGIADSAAWSRLRVGQNDISLSFGPVGTLVALVLVPFPVAVALQALLTLGRLLTRHQAAVKIVVNVSSDSISTAAAGCIAMLAGDPGSIRSPVAILVLAIGCLVGGGLPELLIPWVVAAAQNASYRSLVEQALTPRLVSLGAAVAMGYVAVELAIYSPFTLTAIPVIGVLLLYVNRGNLRHDQENDVWRQLSESGRETEQLSEAEIVPIALARVAALIRCDHVEIVLRGAAEPGRSLSYSGGLRGLDGAPRLGFSPPIPLPAEGLPEPQRVGATTVVEVGLHGPDAPLGVLRASFDRELAVRERELQVLATYARNLGATISNARLYADALREAELKAWLAHHDHLTGLLNRPGLLELAPIVMESVKRHHEVYALLVLDMDHFKQVNDTLGHDAGDRLLQHVSSALAHRVRRQDIAARLEGDRFAVLLRHLPDDAMVEGIVDDILRTISRPIEHEGMQLSLECSAGYAVSPVDGDSMEELLTRADVAAGQAKASPGSYRRWRNDGASARDRMALTADMRLALEHGEQLLLHYQPKIDLRTGAITSVEALARWQHPTRGRLSPADFIPMAEQSGLARPFTLSVIEQALAAAAGWRAAGLGSGDISVAVNLSARNLLDQSLPDDVTRLCALHGFPTRLLVLEITETVVVSELETVTEVLSKLRKVGVQLSVDDFGTGYSSLKFLQSIQVNEVKIDKSFVDTMLTSQGDAAIVSATIDLGHRLGLRVVAEGVETIEQLDALTQEGCDVVQGYLLARPMPEAEFQKLLASDRGVVIPLRPVRRMLG